MHCATSKPSAVSCVLCCVLTASPGRDCVSLQERCIGPGKNTQRVCQKICLNWTQLSTADSEMNGVLHSFTADLKKKCLRCPPVLEMIVLCMPVQLPKKLTYAVFSKSLTSVQYWFTFVGIIICLMDWGFGQNTLLSENQAQFGLG